MRKKDNFFPSTLISAALPAALGLFVAALVASPRFRKSLTGGGAQQASNDAREAQWSMLDDRLISWPFGHGVGEAGHALGYVGGGGTATVDSYVISALLDFGIAGGLAYFLFFIAVIGLGMKTLSKRTAPELGLPPMVAGLSAFVVIKIVLSQPQFHGMTFLLAGAVVGLCCMSRSDSHPSAPARAPSGD